MSKGGVEVVFHHGGKFLNDGTFRYHGGETSTLVIDIDRWSYFEILAILKEMGYRNVKELWYSLGGGVLEERLELLSDDKGAMHLVSIALLNGSAHLFVVHMVSDPDYILQLQNDVGEHEEGEEIDKVGGEEGDVGGEQGAVGGEQLGEEGVELEEHVNEDAQLGEEGDVGGEQGAGGEGVGGEEDEVGGEEAGVGGEEAGVGGEEADVGGEQDEVGGEEAGVGGEEAADGGEDVVAADGGEDVVGDVGGEEVVADDLVDVVVHADEEEDVDSEDEMVNVGVHGNEEVEEDEFELGIGSGSRSSKLHSQARGLSDSEWESDECGSIDESDDDSSNETPRYGDFRVFSEPVNMKEYKWVLGTYFPEKNDFIDAIRTYGIHNGRKLKISKNDKRRICVKCCGSQGKCPWYAYCAYRSTQTTWQLRKIIDNHTCSREFNIGLVTKKWLSGKLEKTMKANPDINLRNLHNKFSKKWNIGVSRSTTTKAKAMATASIEGCFKLQYERLHDYAHELVRSNPGSTVKVKVQPNGDIVMFNKFYVCLKACKDNFVCCRPIIHLDGCFLKGKYGGELLTAVARDGNDQMCPLAYAVVEVENKETWTWFLELLIDDLGGGGICSTCTFMSDQQKGLMQAFQQLLPGVDQRFCVRHLYANFRKKFPGIILRQLLWKAAAASHPQAWESVMRQIKDVNEDAFKHLISIPPRFWSRSRFSGRPSSDTLVNNISEAFNSVIVDARGKPIITMLEDIRSYLMKRWASNRQKITKYEGSICPKIQKRLHKELKKTQYWIPSWSGMRVFEIKHASNIAEKYVVDVDKKDCTCRKWILTGIPCCHALTAMRFLNMNPEDCIPNWFRTSTYEETYNPIIFPVNGPELWQRTPYPDLLPPPKRVLPGRPRKKRRLESWEQMRDDTQLGQAGIPKRCGICRQVGHRRTNCPQASQHPQPTANPTEVSQEQDHQATPHSTQGSHQQDHQPTPHATQGSQITQDDTSTPV